MIKQLIKGALTFIPGVYKAFSGLSTGGTDSPRYCYSVWLRYLVMAQKSGLPTNPQIIAELGPGDSIGIGLAALISGADRYYAFDVYDYANPQRNLEIFDDLVRLFENKEDIPGEDEFPDTIPYLDSYSFPDQILTAERLSASLDPDRLSFIRNSITGGGEGESVITYKVPWYDSQIIERDTVDMIFSQAVLEHVNSPETAYDKIYSWLKPGGVMTSSIDYRSHGYADRWNGHWQYSDFMWKLIIGKRAYGLNRLPHSEHLSLMKKAGFKIVSEVPNKLPSEIGIREVAPRFSSMQDSDLTTATAFIQAQK